MAACVYLDDMLTKSALDFGTIISNEIFGLDANLILFILPFFLMEIIINGEEIGWCGYILPRLQSRFNALTTAIILGLGWGFWHLPKFLSHWDPVVCSWFMVHILAFAVLLTWLYNSTNGSRLLVAILHAASITAGVISPMANTASSEKMGSYIIYVLLEVSAAVPVIYLTEAKTLSSNKTIRNSIDHLWILKRA